MQIVLGSNNEKASTSKCSKATLFLKILTKFL